MEYSVLIVNQCSWRRVSWLLLNRLALVWKLLVAKLRFLNSVYHYRTSSPVRLRGHRDWFATQPPFCPPTTSSLEFFFNSILFFPNNVFSFNWVKKLPRTTHFLRSTTVPKGPKVVSYIEGVSYTQNKKL